jgi:hypothetical protein
MLLSRFSPVDEAIVKPKCHRNVRSAEESRKNISRIVTEYGHSVLSPHRQKNRKC